MKPEEKVEKYLCDRCLDLGVWALKAEHLFVGFPDRILLIPGGRFALIELKAKRGAARAAQSWVHGILRRLGFEPVVLHTSEAVDEYLENLLA